MFERPWLWISAGAALLCAAAGTLVTYAWISPGESNSPVGLRIGKHVPPEDVLLVDWLEERKERVSKTKISLTHKFQVYELELGNLGVSLDVPTTFELAMQAGRSEVLLTRVQELMRIRRGEVNIPLQFYVDMRVAQAALAEVSRSVYRAPTDAYLNLSEHARVPAVRGEALDVEATVLSLMEELGSERDSFSLVVKEVPASVTEEDLLQVDITKVVATFETKFHTYGTGGNRAVNIGKASKAIDGTVLLPGQEFSFNGVVGRRTLAKGYMYAPVIVGDEMEPGVGGGICQVASTMYAAALFGALQIRERWAHSRPSSYTQLGLDATVSYPGKDLKFVNSLPYPVVLHVHSPKQGVLRAEVLGGEPIAKVKYSYGVAKSEPFARRVVPKSWFTGGKIVRKQKGNKGYAVSSVVEFDFGTGEPKKTSYHSQYRPVPEVFWVAEDYDAAQLPALPEGAKGLESSDGEAVEGG